MVGSESAAFEEWAASKGLQGAQIAGLEDFLGLFDSGEFTNNETLNGKISKALSYIPDILQTLSKAEGIAPAIKIAAGENPTVDEIKYTVERFISPILRTIGENIEKKFTGEIGQQLGRGLVAWGEKLATLPTRILEKIGPADLIASLVDVGLLAADAASGNYRAQNHDIPELLTDIPVIGQLASIFSSVRDLLDSAMGVPTNQEGAEIIQQNLYDSLWAPAIDEYNTIMETIANKEGELSTLRDQIAAQQERDDVQRYVAGTIDELGSKIGTHNPDKLVNW